MGGVISRLPNCLYDLMQPADRTRVRRPKENMHTVTHTAKVFDGALNNELATSARPISQEQTIQDHCPTSLLNTIVTMFNTVVIVPTPRVPPDLADRVGIMTIEEYSIRMPRCRLQPRTCLSMLEKKMADAPVIPLSRRCSITCSIVCSLCKAKS